MFVFILRRFAQAIVVMLTVAFLAFMLFQYVGDPVTSLLGQDATQEQRDALRKEIVALGEKATRTTPFAWLSMESGADRMSCELRLALWPGGERRKLADVDWHGRWAKWV